MTEVLSIRARAGSFDLEISLSWPVLIVLVALFQPNLIDRVDGMMVPLREETLTDSLSILTPEEL